MLGVLIAGNIVFHVEEILHGQRRLWRSHRHCRVDRAHHAGGRTCCPELHQQLAGAEQPGPASDCIFTIRRGALAVSALALASWIALPQSVASGALLMIAGVLQADPSSTLGRRSHLRRSSRSGPPHCLCLRAAWLPAVGRGDCVACVLADKCRHSRLDHRRCRSDDARGYDARKLLATPDSRSLHRCRRNLSMCVRWSPRSHASSRRSSRRALYSTLPASPGSWRLAVLRYSSARR